MIDIKVFFKSHFDTQFISDDNLRKFADIHLRRLTANNPGGIYTSIITDTGVVYLAFFGAIGDEAVKTAVKEGLTVELNIEINKFVKDVSQKEGLVRSLYGTGSGTYQEFFPQGLTAYSEADIGNIHTLTQIMMDAAIAHAADVGAPFVTLFTDYHNNILAKRQAQLELMGEVEGKKDVTETTRNAIEVQLMKNILTIAINNVGNFSAVNTYFDQSFIKRGGPDSEQVDLDVLIGETKNVVERTFSADDEITIENTGTDDLDFGLMNFIDEVVAPGTGVTVAAGTSQTVTASQLGDVTQNHFLNVTNNSGADGSCSVTF